MPDPARVTDPASPVRESAAPGGVEELKLATGLCLSGGGYRAMLFHVGVLWRLNEIGWLAKLDRISSVSGGSITAGVLGLNWGKLGFDANGVAANFVEQLVTPTRRLAGETIDAKSVLFGVQVEKSYDKFLFGGATLQDLPDRPRFVMNATSLQSGALFRFSKPYLADYRVGKVDNPRTSLAKAVAASSAFPPLLSPVMLELPPGAMHDQPGTDLYREPYTTNVCLSDGGVYDNMGLETVWKSHKTVLVSDAGQKIEPEEDPHHDPILQTRRVLDLIDNQVRSLRKRQVIDAYVTKEREGAYWGIRTNIADYGLSNSLPCPFDRTMELANTSTRLQAMEDDLKERLMNWGYAVCDAAMRTHVDKKLPAPARFPYPGRGV
jgi:NTE family protein